MGGRSTAPTFMVMLRWHDRLLAVWVIECLRRFNRRVMQDCYVEQEVAPV